MNDYAQLYKLLMDCFLDPAEVRNVIRQVPHGDMLVQSLPGTSGGIKDYAAAAAEKLIGWEMVTADLFNVMLSSTPPPKHGKIKTAAAAMGVQGFGAPPAPEAEPTPAAAPEPPPVIKVNYPAIPAAVAKYLLADKPLVTVEVQATGRARKVMARCRVLNLSDEFADSATVQPGTTHSFALRPMLRFDDVVRLSQGVDAQLEIAVEDIEEKTLLQRTTVDLRVESYNQIPFMLRDSDGVIHHLHRYFGAVVTPDDPAIQRLVPAIARRAELEVNAHTRSPMMIRQIVIAVYDYLKAALDPVYVHTPATDVSSAQLRFQRARLPREVLRDGGANCVEISVLLASLLEALNVQAALVFVPGHMFVAWRKTRGSEEWEHLEGTMLSKHPFAESLQKGAVVASQYAEHAESQGKPELFARVPVAAMREAGVQPLYVNPETAPTLSETAASPQRGRFSMTLSLPSADRTMEAKQITGMLDRILTAKLSDATLTAGDECLTFTAQMNGQRADLLAAMLTDRAEIPLGSLRVNLTHIGEATEEAAEALLEPADLKGLIKTALVAGLATPDFRAAFIAALPEPVGLATVQDARLQLQHDLRALNRMAAPLICWLETAQFSCFGTDHESTFQGFLDKIA